MTKGNNDLIILRGTHPNEVTAFYLAKEVEKAFRQKERGASLVTVPYDYSLNYLVDHEPAVISRWIEYMKCPRHADDLKGHQLKKEFERADPSGKRIENWEWNLTTLFPYPVIDKLIKEYPRKTIVDFHNFDIGTAIDIEDTNLVSTFSLSNMFDGYVFSEKGYEKYFFLEIPAIFKPLPQRVLERRKDVIELIKQNGNDTEDYLDYLEDVADFKESNKIGLTDDESVKIIVQAIEEAIIR